MAEALAIERQFGADGPLHIAVRIGELAVAEDWDGVARFQAIAAKYELLLKGQRPDQ